MHADPRLEISTFLRFTSPSMQCGKSTLLDAVKELVLRPFSVVGIKEAPLFRTVEECAPTLILDEIDQNQNLRSRSDLTGLINASQRRGEAQTVRTVPTGRHLVQRSFFHLVSQGARRHQATPRNRRRPLRFDPPVKADRPEAALVA